MTKYRIIDKVDYIGVVMYKRTYLQYKVQIKFFGIIIDSYWLNIKHPYYDSAYGRDERICKPENLFISDKNTVFSEFIEQYPDIKQYHVYYKRAQKELEQKTKEKNRLRKKRLQNIQYLN